MKKRLPQYFYIGLPEIGNIFLKILKFHPDINIYNKKGINDFFTRNFEKGFEWYCSHFKNNNKIYIDASPFLFLNGEEGPFRIYKYIDSPHFILILCNPVTFIYSCYQMYYNNNLFLNKYSNTFRENPPFDDVIEKIPEFLEKGRFYKKFLVWLQYFNLKNFLIIILEDFLKNPQINIDVLFDFFKICFILDNSILENKNNFKDPLVLILKKWINKNEKVNNINKNYKKFNNIFYSSSLKLPIVPDKFKQILGSFYREDIHQLKQILGIPLYYWI